MMETILYIVTAALTSIPLVYDVHYSLTPKHHGFKSVALYSFIVSTILVIKVLFDMYAKLTLVEMLITVLALFLSMKLFVQDCPPKQESLKNLKNNSV